MLSVISDGVDGLPDGFDGFNIGVSFSARRLFAAELVGLPHAGWEWSRAGARLQRRCDERLADTSETRTRTDEHAAGRAVRHVLCELDGERAGGVDDER